MTVWEGLRRKLVHPSVRRRGGGHAMHAAARDRGRMGH